MRLLGKDTETFYLDEIIPEPYAFYSNELRRTRTDVYEVELLPR